MSSQFEQSKSYQQLGSPEFWKILALWTLVLFVVSVLALIFVPWQQTVIGVGKVGVFSPMERPQSVESQISGRLVEWHVVEGQRVEEGQVLATLADLDPKLFGPHQLESLYQQRQALQNRRQAAQLRLNALGAQLRSLSQSRQAAVPSAVQKVFQSNLRLTVAQQALVAAQQNAQTAQAQYQRLKGLYEKGLRSQRDFELAQLDQVRAQTAVEQAQSQLRVAQQDVTVSQFDQSKVDGDTSASLANVSAAMASAQETIASAESDLAKLAIEVENLQHRRSMRQVKAPCAGTVVRLLSLGRGETVAEGDILATVVPKTKDQAVELYISSWDAPLVSPGRIVRLQFAGWPAIQFMGWPMVATGTFGGRIHVVDATDDGKGKYRLLVRPDQQSIAQGHDEKWPSPQFLRPGTEATGWILLDTVPLGYELWRQFNAFPASLKSSPMSQEESKGDGDEKADKKPKRKVKK